MSKIEVNTVEPQCGTTLTVGESGGSVRTGSNNLQASDGGNLISQSGTTITLGASGDTITLASGASQSGFGRTGTVDWQTGDIKTATFTAENGKGYFCNTTGGTFTVNLPAGSAGAIVSVQDYNNTFDSNKLTIDANGSEKINGGDAGEPIDLTTEAQGATFVYVDSTVGWRTVQDNTLASSGTAFITATGGTISTVCTNFKVHTFTGPGTFTVTGGSGNVDYHVVAGGGGGSYDDGGGGGAGGFRESKCSTTSGCWTASPLASGTSLPVSQQAYPITVGGGGAGGTNPNTTNGASGSNSIFSTITSAGGGFGARNPKCGSPGGSGGGGGASSGPGGTGNTPPVSPPQGNNGGTGTPGSNAAGGGGGAAAAGGNASGSAPNASSGPGGAGVASSITSSPVTRAGGGGGGAFGTKGSGGAGGGGAGGQYPTTAATAGTANTGGGGGGGSSTSAPTPRDGGAGGSGIVIIRYKFQ